MVDDPGQHVHGGAERTDSNRIEHRSCLGKFVTEVAAANEGRQPVVCDQHVGGEKDDERHHDPEVCKQVAEFRPLGVR